MGRLLIGAGEWAGLEERGGAKCEHQGSCHSQTRTRKSREVQNKYFKDPLGRLLCEDVVLFVELVSGAEQASDVLGHFHIVLKRDRKGEQTTEV